ncbi:MAG: prolipoprotein diacylglyceryl transferase [Bacteriovoracaceae bacterium]
MLPILIRLEHFTLYSYPLLLGLAWGFAYHYCESQKSAGLNTYLFNLFFAGNFLMSWIGSKVFFLIFSGGTNSSYYMQSSNFWLGGGFVFYGGLIFCLLFTFFFLYLNKLSFSSLVYFLPALPFAHAIGRIGCLLAGCCFGSPTESILGVHIHEEKLIPVQLFESLLCLGIGLVLVKLIKMGKTRWALPVYLLTYGLGRFALEFLRADEVRGKLVYLSSSQWVSIVLIILSMSLFLKNSKERSSF